MAEYDTDDTPDTEAGLDPSRTAASGEPRAGEVEAQRDEYRASLQRVQADYQNLRRRLQSDIDAAVVRAKTPLLQDLLLVLDYLDMALATPVTTQEGQSLHAGVEMTKNQLVRALEREGVRPVPETGPFDPAVHQAVASIETDDLAPNTIVATQRKGYTLNGAVLRPAQVTVAVAPRARATREEFA